MSKETKKLVGVIDDTPLTKEEYTKLQAGVSLHERIVAPERPYATVVNKEKEAI